MAPRAAPPDRRPSHQRRHATTVNFESERIIFALASPMKPGTAAGLGNRGVLSWTRT